MSEVFGTPASKLAGPFCQDLAKHQHTQCLVPRGPCDPGEGEAGVMPAACPDTCSVFFVKGQVSPDSLSLPGEAQGCLSSKDSTVPVFPLTCER